MVHSCGHWAESSRIWRLSECSLAAFGISCLIHVGNRCATSSKKRKKISLKILRVSSDPASWQVGDFVKRVQMVKVHVMLMNHLRSMLPLIGKGGKQKKIIENFVSRMDSIVNRLSIAAGNFADIEQIRSFLSTYKLTEFSELNSWYINMLDVLLTCNIPRLLNTTQHYFLKSEAVATEDLGNVNPFASSATTADGSLDWVVDGQAKQKYDSIFYLLNPIGSLPVMSGVAAHPLLMQSGLPLDSLRMLWDLVTPVGHMDQDEFTLLMFLIHSACTNGIHTIPLPLPLNFIPPSKRGRPPLPSSSLPSYAPPLQQSFSGGFPPTIGYPPTSGPYPSREPQNPYFEDTILVKNDDWGSSAGYGVPSMNGGGSSAVSGGGFVLSSGSWNSSADTGACSWSGGCGVDGWQGGDRGSNTMGGVNRGMSMGGVSWDGGPAGGSGGTWGGGGGGGTLLSSGSGVWNGGGVSPLSSSGSGGQSSVRTNEGGGNVSSMGSGNGRPVTSGAAQSVGSTVSGGSRGGFDNAAAKASRTALS
jgi:hypothetical protein